MGRFIDSQALKAVGGHGFFGPRVAAPAKQIIQFTAGGPNSTGPWPGTGLVSAGFGHTNDLGCYSAFNGNGSINPNPTFVINGTDFVSAIGYTGLNANAGFVLVLNTGGTVPQNHFTTLAVAGLLTLATASANYFNSNDPVNGVANFTIWCWAEPFAAAIFAQTFTYTVT